MIKEGTYLMFGELAVILIGMGSAMIAYLALTEIEMPQTMAIVLGLVCGLITRAFISNWFSDPVEDDDI